MTAKWTAADVPDQSGRTAIITGSNTGIGYEAAAVLAAKGRTRRARGTQPRQGQRRRRADQETASPNAVVSVQELDLTSLDNIRTAADALRSAHPRIDLLINNAGVMHTPKSTTKDGFELQFGTNHLGHFALTGQLLDNMLGVEGSRVVTISSQAHRFRFDIDFDDLHAEKKYDRAAAYARSKIANLMFTYELARRLKSKGAPDDRDGRTPRQLEHRIDAQLPGLAASTRRLRVGVDRAERRDGCTPDTARRHRPRRTERRILRSRAASDNSVAIRNVLSPTDSRTMRPCSADCGKCPRN